MNATFAFFSTLRRPVAHRRHYVYCACRTHTFILSRDSSLSYLPPLFFSPDAVRPAWFLPVHHTAHSERPCAFPTRTRSKFATSTTIRTSCITCARPAAIVRVDMAPFTRFLSATLLTPLHTGCDSLTSARRPHQVLGPAAAKAAAQDSHRAHALDLRGTLQSLPRPAAVLGRKRRAGQPVVGALDLVGAARRTRGARAHTHIKNFSCYECFFAV